MAEPKMVVSVNFSKYRGRYVAVVGNRVISSGRNARAVWARANKKSPGSIPTLVKVPQGETLVLV